MQIDLMTCKNILMKIGVPKCQAIVPFIVILMEQILSNIKPNHQILKGIINQNCLQINSSLCYICEIMNRNDYLTVIQ